MILEKENSKACDSEEMENLKSEERTRFRNYYRTEGNNKSSEKALEKLLKDSGFTSCSQLSSVLSENEIKGCLCSEEGLKIYNYEASSVFSVNELGTRKKYDRKKAIFASSLLSDFLRDNGLKTCSFEKIESTGKLKWKEDKNGSWTRDIICMKFDYGVQTFNMEKKSIKKHVKELEERYEEGINDLEKEFNDFKNDIKKNLTKEENDEEKLVKDEISTAEAEMEFSKKQLKEKLEKDISYYAGLLKDVEKNENKFLKKAIDIKELRKIFYTNKNGTEDFKVFIEYEDGKKIYYKKLYRSAGKAKEGSCIFINKELYDKAKKFLRMGNKIKDDAGKVVEIEAYQSLVASNMAGKVQIKPENIFVIKDLDCYFKRKTVSFWDLIKETNLLTEEELKKYKRSEVNMKKNVAWDGQALIDCSAFDRAYFFDDEEELNGYILLRQHFFKAAAFCADIKKFFKDYCSEKNLDYENFTVTDGWGKKHFAKDIELITTENALKFKKFSGDFWNCPEEYKEWCRIISENGSYFGIVKTAHESRQGSYQRMSYQYVNCLENDNEKLNSVIKCSVDYLNRLREPDNDYIYGKKKIEDNEFIKFLLKNSSYSNDYDVLVELCRQNRLFMASDYYRAKKRSLIFNYKKDLQSGHIIQEADNLVIVGSPYAMLLKAAGEKDEDLTNLDVMFKVEEGEFPAVQCWTQRFKNEECLAAFRSPFNSRNNLLYLRNKKPEKKVLEYFKRFGPQIIAVNMLGTDTQPRACGSDQDSDAIYTTNEPVITDFARKCYSSYPTIINDISEETEEGNKTENADYETVCAEKDYMLSIAKNGIGQATNAAQLCLTYSYKSAAEKNEGQKNRYEAFVCILSVLAQIYIDIAKKNFNIPKDLIACITDKMNIETNQYPEFWQLIKDRSSLRQGRRKEKLDVLEAEKKESPEPENSEEGKYEEADCGQENAEQEVSEKENCKNEIPEQIASDGENCEEENSEENPGQNKSEAESASQKKSGKKIKINKKLNCPMNFVWTNEFENAEEKKGVHRKRIKTYGMEEFYNPPENKSSNEAGRKHRDVEQLISDFGFEQMCEKIDSAGSNDEDSYLLLRSDFDEMMYKIKKRLRGNNDSDEMVRFFSALINRAFKITQSMQAASENAKNARNKKIKDTVLKSSAAKTVHNRSLLLKTLYTLDKESFLKCFKELKETDKNSWRNKK